jgi:hypothetical protein
MAKRLSPEEKAHRELLQGRYLIQIYRNDFLEKGLAFVQNKIANDLQNKVNRETEILSEFRKNEMKFNHDSIELTGQEKRVIEKRVDHEMNTKFSMSTNEIMLYLCENKYVDKISNIEGELERFSRAWSNANLDLKILEDELKNHFGIIEKLKQKTKIEKYKEHESEMRRSLQCAKEQKEKFEEMLQEEAMQPSVSEEYFQFNKNKKLKKDLSSAQYRKGKEREKLLELQDNLKKAKQNSNRLEYKGQGSEIRVSFGEKYVIKE